MRGIVFSGAVMGLLAYGAYLISYLNYHDYERAITITFVSVTFGQYANLLSRRTYGFALGRYFLSNKHLLGAFAFSISCLLLIIYVPILNLYFHTAPLHLLDWLLPLAAFAVSISIYEILKKKKINPRP